MKLNLISRIKGLNEICLRNKRNLLRGFQLLHLSHLDHPSEGSEEGGQPEDEEGEEDGQAEVQAVVTLHHRHGDLPQSGRQSGDGDCLIGLPLPHYTQRNVQTFLQSKPLPVPLPDWEVEIPEIFIEVEYVEKVEKTGHPNSAEEQHEEGVEQLDHVPVDALTPGRDRRLNICCKNT